MFFIICEQLAGNRTEKLVNRTEKLVNQLFSSITIQVLDESNCLVNQKRLIEVSV